jgi:tetratricopeptide (TPR) repeat protein
MAQLLVAHRRYAEAARVLEESLAAFQKHPATAAQAGITLNNLAVVRDLQGRHEEAARLCQDALGRLRAEFGPDHPIVVRGLENLGTAYSELGRREEAGEAFRQALDMAEARLEPDHPTYGLVLNNYAWFLRRGGDKTNARKYEARAREILKAGARRNGAGMTIDASAFGAR